MGSKRAKKGPSAADLAAVRAVTRIPEGKLGDRPSWDEYGMVFAIGASTRASCENVQAGTYIAAPDHSTLSTGYNGAAHAIEFSCLKTGCRKRLKGLDYEESLNTGECIGVHAEVNAISHLRKRQAQGIEVYNTIFPCHTCAKNLLPFGVEKIVFKSFYSEKEVASTMHLLNEAGVKVFQLDLSPERYMDIMFNRPTASFNVWAPDEQERALKALKYLKGLGKKK